MDPYQRESDGAWMVPTVDYDQERDLRVSGYRELTPEHPRYRQWVRWLQAEQGWAGKISADLPG